MKRVTIAAFLPQMPSGHAYQSGIGEGSNARAALSRAFANLMRKTKGKHIHEIKATITIETTEEKNAD